MEKIRSFIALDLSDETLEELSCVQGILKESEANVKWIKPGSVHLTLKFLGDVAEDKVPAIADRLKTIALQVAPFDLVLGGIGVFPKWNYAKVLWVGIEEGAEEVKKLASMVEDAMAEEGFEKEKRSFSAHLTIGRVRTAKNKEALKEAADAVKVKPVPSRISKIVLYKSTLTQTGAIYDVLAEADLAG